MYDVAVTVRACLRAGTRVVVAWPVEVRGPLDLTGGEALALTPGGGRVGSVLGGALDDQLVELATRGDEARLVDLDVGDVDALVAGLPTGGGARILMAGADRLP